VSTGASKFALWLRGHSAFSKSQHRATGRVVRVSEAARPSGRCVVVIHLDAEGDEVFRTSGGRGEEDDVWYQKEETYHPSRTNKSYDAVCYEGHTHTQQQKQVTI